MDNAFYTQLLKKLNQKPASTTEQSNPLRDHTRLEYHQPYLEIELETSDRSRRTITVATRNISRGGLSVLHSSYTYPGTLIRTQLDPIDGKPHTVTGKVVRCEHRGGVVHEIGIKLEAEIIVQEFIRPDITSCVRVHERVVPSTLQGNVLIVGKDPVIIPLLREYLQRTGIGYGFVENAKQALEKDLTRLDMIMCCINSGDMIGPELARTLRENAYAGPVILMGDCPDESTRNMVRLSAADALVLSPITEKDILCAIADFLSTKLHISVLNAIRKHNCSQTHGSLSIELAKLGIMLDQHTRNADPVQIFATCNKIKSIAPLLGLSTLRELSAAVGESIAATGDPAPHTQSLLTIKAMCTDRASAA